VATRAEAVAACQSAVKKFEEVSQTYESVRNNETDPKLVSNLNEIAQSLEQTRADLAMVRETGNLWQES
jgi:hypothetical protein